MSPSRTVSSLLVVTVLLAAMTAASCTAGRQPAPPPQRHSGFATAQDGTPIYYERMGSGDAVLFIHGLGGNHAVWFHQVPVFAARHTVITISQRGFAPSGGARQGHPLDVLVADAVAVLDTLDIDRAHVVGQSMGGWTALGLALHRPDRLRSVVLADSFAGIVDPVLAEHNRSMMDKARALADRPPPLGVHPALGADFSRRDPAEAYLYQTLTTFGSPAPGAIAARLGETVADPALLSANEVPALFVVGEHDLIFPPALVERAAGRLARSTVVIVPDSGHSPYYERPGRWNDIVLDFIEHRRRERVTVSVRRNPFYDLVRPGGRRCGLTRRGRTTRPQHR